MLNLAKAGNLAVLMFIAYIIFEKDGPDDLFEYCIFGLLIVSPIVNFLALSKKTKNNHSEIWPFILFRRLALEEKKKIEILKKNDG
jgi:hypothetical protein